MTNIQKQSAMLESSGHSPKSRVENGNSIARWSVLVMGTQQETKNMPVIHPDLSIMQLIHMRKKRKFHNRPRDL